MRFFKKCSKFSRSIPLIWITKHSFNRNYETKIMPWLFSQWSNFILPQNEFRGWRFWTSWYLELNKIKNSLTKQLNVISDFLIGILSFPIHATWEFFRIFSKDYLRFTWDNLLQVSKYETTLIIIHLWKRHVHHVLKFF